MQPILYLQFCRNILAKCNSNEDAMIYALLPMLDTKLPNMYGSYFHAVENIPRIVESASVVFCGKSKKESKDSFSYNLLSENAQMLAKMYTDSRKTLGTKNSTIFPEDKALAVLAALTHIYLDIFEKPKQVFLPYSPACSGQWAFWEKVDMYSLRRLFNDPKNNAMLLEAMSQKKVWDVKIDPEKFTDIVRQRLVKEGSFAKPLSVLAMIKAIMIRLGELGAPNINYETIDVSIRTLLRYLNINDFVRVDREIEFCRQLEANLAESLQKIL